MTSKGSHEQNFDGRCIFTFYFNANLRLKNKIPNYCPNSVLAYIRAVFSLFPTAITQQFTILYCTLLFYSTLPYDLNVQQLD